MGKNRPLNDVTAFERQWGLHVSLGKKHNVFKKASIPKNMRFHIDMFVDVKEISVDEEIVLKF